MFVSTIVAYLEYKKGFVSLITMLITVASEDEKWTPPMMTSRIGKARPL